MTYIQRSIYLNTSSKMFEMIEFTIATRRKEEMVHSFLPELRVNDFRKVMSFVWHTLFKRCATNLFRLLLGWVFFLVIGRPMKEIYFAFWKIKGNENEKQIPLVALSKNLKTKKEKLIQKKKPHIFLKNGWEIMNNA